MFFRKAAESPKPSQQTLSEIEEQNVEAAESSLDHVIGEVVSDVAPPSPVADMNNEAAAKAEIAAASTTPTASGVVKRGRGRPRKDGGVSASSPNQSGATRPRPEIKGIKPSYDVDPGIEPCADLCTMMVNTSGMVLGGEKAVMLPIEREMCKSGFVAYFKAKGIDNVPPWVLLLGAVSPYYLRIMADTPAKTKIIGVVANLWYGAKNFFSRKRKNARFNSGNDTKRENNTSEEISEKSL